MAPVLAAVGGDGRIYATDEAVALLHQAQAGDRDAFADLYHGYRDLIGRYAYVRTGDRDAAEDLIHDTFTDALIELPRADDDVVGWLLRLASRACTRHLWSQRRHLRHSLAPQVWGLLLRDGYVDDVLCGARDGDWLVTQGREILNSRESTRDVVDVLPAGPQAGQERAWALSQLVARYAQDDPAVVAFRNAHLPQGLLAWAEVERWIDAQGALDGDRTVDVTATLPAGTSVDRHPGNGRMEFTPPLRHVVGQVRFAVRTLPFAMPGDAGVRRVGVTAGGVLSRLAALAEDVAAAFAWQPAQAVVFILTGTNPYITPVRVTTPAIKVRHGHNLVATVRIQLDIDPAASPEDVLRAFEQARGNQRSTRQRAMSIKHLRLAAFAGAEHDDKPWAERHRRWNTEFPQYAYKDESNFRRDAARAIARVLNPHHAHPHDRRTSLLDYVGDSNARRGRLRRRGRSPLRRPAERSEHQAVNEPRGVGGDLVRCHGLTVPAGGARSADSPRPRRPSKRGCGCADWARLIWRGRRFADGDELHSIGDWRRLLHAAVLDRDQRADRSAFPHT